ncbi:Uncharacterised protein [Vibrio cholerae]|nr:Uncharacterised protein [Vibrio cholerae]CSI29251.1 Uncharacterised protein [Vibrio cholerae]
MGHHQIHIAIFAHFQRFTCASGDHIHFITRILLKFWQEVIKQARIVSTGGGRKTNTSVIGTRSRVTDQN